MSQLERELNSGLRYDSIFFDIHFGFTKKEFYNKCWEYNKRKKIFHGSRNMNVKYTIEAPADSVSSISMLFYPDFNFSSEVRKMDVEFAFNGWALWNNHLFSDKLVPFVKDQVMEWYGGNSFWEIGEGKKKRWAKIDGNREIIIWTEDNHLVKMTILDKTYEPFH